MVEYQKRQIARKVLISELIDNTYIVKEDGPNYIKIRDLKVSRVNIVAIVISLEIEANIKTILIDDGTGKIPLRIFDSISVLDDVSVGDPVTIIGWIREYGEERYVTPEILKKIDDPKWIELRKKEISLSQLKNEIKTDIEENKEIEVIEDIEIIEEVENLSKSDKIYELIKRLDSGSGANIEEIISESDDPNTEKIIISLMKEGDIFEIRPGRFKVLE
jgi:RPA family protein